MADITFSATLDDKAVSKGLDTIAAKAKQSTQQVEQSFAKSGQASDQMVSRFASQAASFVSISRGVQFLGRAMDEYAKKNIDAAASLERIGDAKDALLVSIGSDISPLLDQVAEILAKADEVRNKIVNFVTDLPGKVQGAYKYLTTGDKHAFDGTNKGEDLDALNKKNIAQQKEIAETQLLGVEKRKLKEKQLREENRLYEADLVKNQIDLGSKMEEIARKAKEKKLSGSAVNELQSMARAEKDLADQKAKDDENARKLQFEQQSKAGAAEIAQEEEKERQAEKAWQKGQEQFRLEQEKLAIESQALKNNIDGNKDVVSIMETKLKLQERLAAIAENDVLDADEKSLAATQARAVALESIVKTLENPEMSAAEKRAAGASISAGAGSIGFGAVFGNKTYGQEAPGLKEAREQLSVARESLKHLSTIATWAKDMSQDKDSVVARFGL